MVFEIPPKPLSNAAPAYEKGAYASTQDDIAGSVNAVSTNLAQIDAKDLQSISLTFQALAIYTGTLIVQTSNAVTPGTTDWTTKALINGATGGLASTDTRTAQAVGAYVTFSGDIGARWIRVIQSAWTAGQVRVIANLSALSTAAIPTQTVGITASASGSSIRAVAGVVSEQASTTVLAASASYLGTAVDQGTTPATRSNQLRVLVAHTAGLTPGTLEIQEAQDATTYRITRRVPIPSDGLVHSLAFPMPSRAYKVNFVNGATTQTAFFIQHGLVGIDAPTDDAAVLQFVLSTTALGVSATFTGPVLDLGPNHRWSLARLMAFSDQSSAAAGIAIQQSRDGASWRSSASASLTAGNAGVIVEERVVMRYLRPVYINGATAQTAFDLNLALVSL